MAEFKKLLNESFINDVKDGKYDNCLNIKNNSLYDIVQ